MKNRSDKMKDRSDRINDLLSRFSLWHKEDKIHFVDMKNGTIAATSADHMNTTGTTASQDEPERKRGKLTDSLLGRNSNDIIPAMQKTETSTISQDMVITGSLEATNNVKILGTILGNVTSKGEVWVSGKVEGDIFAARLNFDAPSTNGNINVTDTTRIAEQSTVNGNINSVNVYVSGTVNGDIIASGHTSLLSTAVVTGNIETGTLEIASGAVINGKIAIKR